MNTLVHLVGVSGSHLHCPLTSPTASSLPNNACSSANSLTASGGASGVTEADRRDQFAHFTIVDIFRRWPSYERCLVDICGLLPDSLNGLVKVSRDLHVWRLIPRLAAANAHNSVHGGYATYIADTLSTFHLSLYSGRPTHVSANIHMAFHSAIPVEGEAVLLTTQVVKVGRRLAYLHASFALESAPHDVLGTMQQTKAFLPDKTTLSLPSKM